MKNIVLFGGGNIAQAIVEGLIYAGHQKNNIFYVDRNPKNKKILKKLKIRSLKENTSLKIDLFILAVKPKDALSAYKEILKDYKNPKIVSLVAGIKSKKYLEMNKNIKFLRAMPNTSSRFNLGITALYNCTFSRSDFKKIVMLFKKIGIVIEVEKESKLDTFTGMIGSGPAYFFYLLKSYEKKLIPLCDGDKDKANYVMVNLIKGIGMSVKNNKDLNKLIAAVASKKGTTEAGLKSFKSNNLDKVFEEGISAAIKRSKEISNEF